MAIYNTQIQELELLKEKYGLNIYGYESILEDSSREPYYREKMDDYIKDVEKFLEEQKRNINKRVNIVKTWAYINIGLNLAGILVTMAVPIAGLVLILTGLIALIIMTIQANKLQKEIDKLNRVKSTLLDIKSKSKNSNEKEKISNLIEKIDHVIKSSTGN